MPRSRSHKTKRSRSKSRSRSRSRSRSHRATIRRSHRSRSHYGKKGKRGCRGGSTLKQLKKAARSCGITGYSKMKKCTLSRKIHQAKCGNVQFMSPKKHRSYKKRKSRSRSRSKRLGHTWRGKHVVLV